MRRRKKLFGVGIVAIVMAFTTPRASAVTATRGPIEKDGKIINEKAIFLENEFLKVGIVSGEYAGQVMHFIYKPTGEDLSPTKIPQGLCMDRMGEGRQFFVTHGRDHEGSILSQSEEKAEALISYTWDYDYDGVKTTFDVRKTYLLAKGSAALRVRWELKNTGTARAPFTPWIKHVARSDEEVLIGPRRLLLEKGPTDPGGEFIKPATDWTVMRCGEQDSEKHAMLCSVTEYHQIFQQFLCEASYRITLETILSRTELEPGKSWQTTYVISAMANLGNILYACPELSAGIAEVTPTAGEEAKVKVLISPATRLGQRRLEGEVTTLEGKLVAKLPNREVNLIPGKISSVDYKFTPPANGVYNIVLTMFLEGNTPLRLGAVVNSQERNVLLPVVVGPTPGLVVKKWQSGAFAFPRRESRIREAQPTLVNTSRVKVGQVRVPDRVFPEDRITISTQTKPARARLAKGEYEDIQFVVDLAEEKDVMDLTVDLTAIAHKDGSRLENVQLREAVYLTTSTPSGYKSFAIGDWPEPLFETGWQKRIPNAPITKKNIEICRKSKRRIFFVIAQAPREATAGTYEGTVSLKLRGKSVSTFPVTFAVDNFAIPKRPHLRCSTGMVGFGAKRWANNAKIMGLSEDEIADVENEKTSMDRYRELNLEYGWTPVMWAGPAFWKKYFDYGRGVNVYSGAKQQDVPWLKERGLLKYAQVYAPFDEHQDSQVPEVAKWCRQWKEKCDIPIMDCYYGGNVQPLFGLVDIWLGQSPKQEWAKERRKQGDRFVACNASLQWYLEYEPVVGRSEFWNHFQTGYDGLYIYSTCRWTDDIYKKNWSTGGNYVGSVVYPSPNGVCTSIRFESLRDGIEDYDYLAILRERIESKKGQADAAVLNDARGILEDAEVAEKVKTIDGLYRLREEIADLILKLQRGATGRADA